jgi:triosephosphate isomerase
VEQLRAACEGLDPERLGRVVVAYEPRWAIGQGVTPTAAEVTDMLGHVRRTLARVVSAEAEAKVSVLYGGSVKASNAGELLHLPGCSGALIGGASLDAAHFAKILKLA